MGIFFDDRGRAKPASIGAGVIVGIILLIGLFGLADTMYTVPAGHEGVIFDQRGGTQQESLGEGIGFKTPFLEDQYDYNIKRQVHRAQMEAASDDIQIVKMNVAVHYRIDAGWAWWIHQNVGTNYKSIVIVPATEQSVKAVTARYPAAELIHNRSVLAPTIEEELRPKLDAIHVTLVDVDVENIEFSTDFTRAIERKVVAEQTALEEKRLLVAEQHKANQTIVKAEAEAEAARIISEQLKVSPDYIPYLMMEKWDGEMPNTYVAGDSGFTTFLELNASGSAST